LVEKRRKYKNLYFIPSFCKTGLHRKSQSVSMKFLEQLFNVTLCLMTIAGIAAGLLMAIFFFYAFIGQVTRI